jgi:hypothetical protein
MILFNDKIKMRLILLLSVNEIPDDQGMSRSQEMQFETLHQLLGHTLQEMNPSPTYRKKGC